MCVCNLLNIRLHSLHWTDVHWTSVCEKGKKKTVSLPECSVCTWARSSALDTRGCTRGGRGRCSLSPRRTTTGHGRRENGICSLHTHTHRNSELSNRPSVHQGQRGNIWGSCGALWLDLKNSAWTSLLLPTPHPHPPPPRPGATGLSLGWHTVQLLGEQIKWGFTNQSKREKKKGKQSKKT